MIVSELIQYLAGFPSDRQVMLNMTTGQMDQFKFVAINFVDEVGFVNGNDSTSEVVLISNTTPGEEEDFHQN